MQRAIFHASAIGVLRTFPLQVKRTVGKAIWELQLGKRLGMPLAKPMRSIAAGAEELRVKDASGAYRVFYFTRSADGILVFHAFVKKSQKTPLSEIKLGQKRLRELLDEIK